MQTRHVPGTCPVDDLVVALLVALAAAAAGLLPALAGVIAQEVIDVAAVLNALRAAIPPKDLTDF